MKNGEHPFFCNKKNCRKTAWDTPEYLTDDDWKLVYNIIEALQSNNKNLFDKILYGQDGSSEISRYKGEFYFDSFIEKCLPKLEEALINKKNYVG